MKIKIERYLGLAKRSGNLVSGTHTCTMTMNKGKVKLLIIAQDTSEGTRDKIIQVANKTKTKYKIYGISDDLSHATGSSGRSVFGIIDNNFANTIVGAIEAEETKEKEVF